MCIMFQEIGSIAEKIKQPTLQGSASAYMGVEVMNIYNIDIIGIECEDDFVGVFAKEDFDKHVIRRNLNPRETTLYEVMTINPPTVDSDISVKEAYETMLNYKWEHIPVLEHKRLCGIVSMRDLGKDVMSSFEKTQSQHEMVMNYIQGGESYAMAKYEN